MNDIVIDLNRIAAALKGGTPFHHMGIYCGKNKPWLLSYSFRTTNVNYILHLVPQFTYENITIIFDRDYIYVKTNKINYFINTCKMTENILSSIKDVLFAFEERSGSAVDSDIWTWLD